MNRTQNKERQGEIYIFFEVLLWSLFPVITILSYHDVIPLVSLAWSTLFATMLFGTLVFAKRKWHELKDTTALKDTLMATLIIGIGFYSLFFWGLQYTTAGNASIIAQTEVLFSFIFFHLIRKEPISQKHIFGTLLLVIGAMIILLPNLHTPNKGDILVLLAVLSAPLGNFFARRARTRVSSETIMFTRSIVSAVFFFGLIYIMHGTMYVAKVQNSLLFLLINGVLLLGLSKILWIEGIHRISVTKANALNSLGPLLTLLFAWFLLGENPRLLQLCAFIPMFIGVLLLSKAENKNIDALN